MVAEKSLKPLEFSVWSFVATCELSYSSAICSESPATLPPVIATKWYAFSFTKVYYFLGGRFTATFSFVDTTGWCLTSNDCQQGRQISLSNEFCFLHAAHQTQSFAITMVTRVFPPHHRHVFSSASLSGHVSYQYIIAFNTEILRASKLMRWGHPRCFRTASSDCFEI